MRSQCKRSKDGFILPVMFVSVALMIAIMVAQLIYATSIRRTQLTHADNHFRALDSVVIEAALREAMYDYVEVSNFRSTDTVTDNVQARLNAIDTDGIELTIDSIGANLDPPPSMTASMFPDGIPSLSASSLNLSFESVQDPRAFNVLDNGMRVVNLAEDTISISYAAGAGSRKTTLETTTFDYDIKILGVPLANYSILGYGLPASSGGAILEQTRNIDSSGLLAATRTAAPFRVQILNPKSNSTGSSSMTDVYTGDGSLPYFYRSHVSLLWNTFEHIMGPVHQQALTDEATLNGTLIDLASPAAHSAISVSGGVVSLDADASLAPAGTPFVFFDFVGNQELIIESAADLENAAPLNVVVRNLSAPFQRTHVRLNSNRPIIFWGFGADIIDAEPAVRGNFGMLLLDSRSIISSPMNFRGTLAFNANTSGNQDPIASSQLSNVTINPMSASMLGSVAPYSPFATIVLIEKD